MTPIAFHQDLTTVIRRGLLKAAPLSEAGTLAVDAYWYLRAQ